MTYYDTTDNPATQADDNLAKEAERKAGELGREFEWVGRAGWVAKGVIYALLGLLFLDIARSGGGSQEEASQTGAIEQIAETSYGTVLLIVLAIGLVLYTIWRALSVVMPGDWTGRALLDRIGFAVSAVTYGTLLVATIGFLRNSSSGGQSNDRLVEGLVKDVLAMTGGQTMVFLAGLGIVGIGIAFIHKGWTHSFRDQISGDYGQEGTWIDRLGMIGWIARGLSMIIIGYFLCEAAWTFDADQAAGFDDSIRQIVGNPLGRILAFAVGFGFVAFGAFAALSARHRDLKGPRND